MSPVVLKVRPTVDTSVAEAVKVGVFMKGSVRKRHAAIEIRHLCYFVAAAEQGSFRKAGVALEVQESAVSRRVRDLEDHIGASLFQRHNCGVTLTAAGDRFLRSARKVMETIRQEAYEVGTIGQGHRGLVRIGIFASLASGFLTELLREYGRGFDGVRLDFVDGEPERHVAEIRQQNLDVAFVAGKSRWLDCDTAHLWSERVFVVLPEAHSLSQCEQVTWDDLRTETFIVSDLATGREAHDHLLKRLAGPRCHPEIHVQYVGQENLLPLVALGRGLTVTSEATTAARFPGIVYRPIRGEVLPFSAVWSPKNDNPALRRLLSLAKSQSRRLI